MSPAVSKWMRPKAKTYDYNYSVMSNYYKPMTKFLEGSPILRHRSDGETPGAQTYAERIHHFPIYGGEHTSPPSHPDIRSPRISTYAFSMSDPKHSGRSSLNDNEDSCSSKRIPLWKKHPFRLPGEDETAPMQEGTIWPESVPHFNLVSSYDLMTKYLDIKPPVLNCSSRKSSDI